VCVCVCVCVCAPAFYSYIAWLQACVDVILSGGLGKCTAAITAQQS